MHFLAMHYGSRLRLALDVVWSCVRHGGIGVQHPIGARKVRVGCSCMLQDCLTGLHHRKLIGIARQGLRGYRHMGTGTHC